MWRRIATKRRGQSLQHDPEMPRSNDRKETNRAFIRPHFLVSVKETRMPLHQHKFRSTRKRACKHPSMYRPFFARIGGVLPLICIALISIVYFFPSKPVTPTIVTTAGQKDYSPCTRNQILQSFGLPLNGDERGSIIEEENPMCWSITNQQVPQIPTSAIVNRNSMPLLGKGFKGNVHLAYIDIGDTVSDNRNGANICSAAIKTDHCHGMTSNPFFDRTGRSCAQDYSYLMNDASYLAGEVAGSLFSNVYPDLDGWMPSWGVVVRPTALWTRLPRSWLQGSPYSDGRMVGVIFPLMQLETLDTYSRQTGVADKIPNVASFFLSSAKTLATLSKHGLAHQDIIFNNIGVTSLTPSMGTGSQTMISPTADGGEHLATFLYDNTYLSYHGQACTPSISSVATTDSSDEKATCSCLDDIHLSTNDEQTVNRIRRVQKASPAQFPTTNYTDHWIKGLDPIQSDFVAYRDIVIHFVYGYPSNKRPQGFVEKLKTTRNIQDLVSVLEEFATMSLQP